MPRCRSAPCWWSRTELGERRGLAEPALFAVQRSPVPAGEVGGRLVGRLQEGEQRSVGIGRSPDAAERKLLGRLAELAELAYRALVWETPAFVDFFRSFTPVDELALLAIGSRPPRRPDGPGYLEGLRAIPWVFAWTQNRTLLPAWYGCGTAFAAADRDELAQMYRELPFFTSLVDNLEMTLAKSSLSIARGYLRLVDDAALYEEIAAEHARTVAGVLAATGVSRLLERQPMLRRSIDPRNPYVDPMNALQVELLARWRGGDEEARLPLLRSIAGIAAALRNTG